MMLPPGGEGRRQKQHDDGAEYEDHPRRLLGELQRTGRDGAAEERAAGDTIADLVGVEEADEQVGARHDAERERDESQDDFGTGESAQLTQGAKLSQRAPLSRDGIYGDGHAQGMARAT